ncbi:MAG TPA: ABC transporter permease [Thermoanaerobaculia bacterium]|nr:ABC transporter permease [Thermoanaerobaculia bacterium]
MKIPFKYNLRSLFVRRGTTLMTILSIAFVVLVYVGVLALAGGLRVAFTASGDPRNVLVLRDGAKTELESFFDEEKRRQLAALSGVAKGQDGQPLASASVYIIQILKRTDGSESNVSLRGVEPAMFALRPQVALVEGRRFEPGRSEVIVGQSLAKRFPGLRLGNDIAFGRVRFKVVGVFDAAGGSFNSEVWGATRDVSDAFRRGSSASSMVLQTASPEAAARLVKVIEGDQRLKLKPMLETRYYAEQAGTNAQQFVILGSILAVVMAVGACFAAANTMFSQVSARAHEIGTLRALGFRRRNILTAFLIEAGLLGVIAGVLGAVLALPLNGLTAGTMNAVTFSEISFALRTTPNILAGGVLLAVVTALIGGFPAALSASRRQITALLRER